MRIWVRSVESVGVAIRAMRKASGIRQDDVPGVSHVFLRDLEKGKDTVQFGRVLKVLDELGVRMVLEVPESQADAVQSAIAAHLPLVCMEHTRTLKKEGE
jgi:hypothetical protein